jgi:hypothetical protein
VEIRSHRMIHLGYGKYWRSDHILGLLPIEEGRGPGRRTEVYVANREEPILASRAEDTILEDMAVPPEDESRRAELLSAVEELRHVFEQLSPVLRRMLRNEGGLDVQAWLRRLGSLSADDPSDDGQEELFPAD